MQSYFILFLVGLFVRLDTAQLQLDFFFSFLPFSSETNDIDVNFFLEIFTASPYYRGKKLVEFELDLW